MNPLPAGIALAYACLLLLGAGRPAQGADGADGADGAGGLRLERDGHWLVVRGDGLPDGGIRINYLEAYCRAGSTDADWVGHTVIPHRSVVVSEREDGKALTIRDTLAEGVTVKHVITAHDDEIRFDLTLHNPTEKASEAHWAQPCIRVGEFTGFDANAGRGDKEDYLGKCFVFIGGELSRMPTDEWATEARYTPGQVWRPAHVPRSDVNPRPLNPVVPSNGLIGCFSADGSMILASAWEPYQELFQGVARCIHSDFRIGGLLPGETKRVRGRLYVLPADVPALVQRYRDDFPEQSGDR